MKFLVPLIALLAPLSANNVLRFSSLQAPGISPKVSKSGCGCSSQSILSEKAVSSDAVRRSVSAALLPLCPTDCSVIPFPSQTRCVNASVWLCSDSTPNRNWTEVRERRKVVCSQATYVYCSGWVGNRICCGQEDPGPGCAGNSGLPVCSGSPVPEVTD